MIFLPKASFMTESLLNLNKCRKSTEIVRFRLFIWNNLFHRRNNLFISPMIWQRFYSIIFQISTKIVFMTLNIVLSIWIYIWRNIFLESIAKEECFLECFERRFICFIIFLWLLILMVPMEANQCNSIHVANHSISLCTDHFHQLSVSNHLFFPPKTSPL